MNSETSLRPFVHGGLEHLQQLRRREVDPHSLFDGPPPQQVTLGDGSTLSLTVDASDALQFRKVDFPADWQQRRPLQVGVDPSSTFGFSMKQGNVTVLLAKPIAVAAQGDLSLIQSRLHEQRWWITLASNIWFDAPPDIRDAVLFDHFALQHDHSNELKHLKEVGMIIGPLSETVAELSRYGYRHERCTAGRGVVVLKDGSILSNAESVVAERLGAGRGSPGASFDRLRLHHIVRTAAEEQGIPIIGVVKDAQAPILARFFRDVRVFDYGILEALARRQHVEAGILPPIRRSWPGSPLQIEYTFAYFEKGISPLRIETVVSSPLRDSGWREAVDDVFRLALEETDCLELNTRRYRLPGALLKADQLTRHVTMGMKEFGREYLGALAKQFGLKVVEGVA